MKKILTILLLCLSTTAFAQHGLRHGHHHSGYNPGWWIAPAVIGGVVTYAITRPQQPPPQPTVVYTMPPPPPQGYYWENIHDATCNCYRTVLVPYQPR